MKFKTTKKDVVNGYALCIRAGYCALQYLLNYESPVAYTSSRTYGWRADIYDMGCVGLPGICIITGYGPFGWTPPAGLIKEYNDKAEAVILDRDNWRECDKKVYALLCEFVDKCRAAYYE